LFGIIKMVPLGFEGDDPDDQNQKASNQLDD
jgi:hypothetical protein